MAKSEASNTKRWKYGELAIDDILDAAAGIVQEKGIDALTMRSLARELGISSMSVYHYLTDKKHLLKLLIDRLLKSIQVQPGDDWRERIKVCYTATYKSFSKYPGLLIESHQYYGVGEGSRIANEVFAVLCEAGFEERQVRSWVLTVTNYQLGFIQWERIMRQTNEDIRPKRFLGHYTRGLDVILDGLEHQKQAD